MDTASPFLMSFVRSINRLSDYIGRFVSWFVLAVVMITFVVVVMRYAFNTGSVFLQELILYFHNYVIMLGASYALLKGAHVRVDIFYRPMSEKRKAWIDLFGFLLLLLPSCAFIFYIALDYVQLSWQIREGSQEAGGVDARYLFKTSILIMPVLVAIQGAAEALKAVLVLTGHLSEAKLLDEHDEEHPL
ncbi:C4-dicarboxylate ABC transporter permease [Veronia nyctiphanis]|uniref:TRAP transporter small permease protein n=1 Tax=Veronia nyctiphanis TaxID=1278244 RepID=A0A4V1LT42_9GAMM|nr:TRAP transporter small permease subunit [Veronia nyctiphanis]RXJ73888.1 C4-dicarboxylate ABC transporter permease [Veronia nyctiphanis]